MNGMKVLLSILEKCKFFCFCFKQVRRCICYPAVLKKALPGSSLPSRLSEVGGGLLASEPEPHWQPDITPWDTQELLQILFQMTQRATDTRLHRIRSCLQAQFRSQGETNRPAGMPRCCSYCSAKHDLIFKHHLWHRLGISQVASVLNEHLA